MATRQKGRRLDRLSELHRHGLHDEGEIVAEICGTWNGREIGTLKKAFDREWSLSTNADLDEQFLRAYREAPRAPPQVAGRAKRQPGSPNVRGKQKIRVFWVPDDVPESTSERVEKVLEAAQPDRRGSWFLWSRKAMSVRPGDKLVVASSETGYALAEAGQPIRVGSRTAVPYEPLRRCGNLRMTKALAKGWVRAGALMAGRSWYRSRSLTSEQWDAVVALARTR